MRLPLEPFEPSPVDPPGGGKNPPSPSDPPPDDPPQNPQDPIYPPPLPGSPNPPSFPVPVVPPPWNPPQNPRDPPRDPNPPEPPEECEPPAPTSYRYFWQIEKIVQTEQGIRYEVVVAEREGQRCFAHTFTQDDRGKRFRVRCRVRVSAELSDGTVVDCGEGVGYAFVRVLEPNKLEVELKADPEPAGVWQTIKIQATVLGVCEESDQSADPTPPLTFTWTFGDDPTKVVVRGSQDNTDEVHYFYMQNWCYLVHVQVTDADGRQGSASMWVRVGLAVRLWIPPSMWVPLREYNAEGLADPDWNPDNMNPEQYLPTAQLVSVGIRGLNGFQIPFEYPHHTQIRGIQYPRVDPLWGIVEIPSFLQRDGASVLRAQCQVHKYSGSWSLSQDWGTDLRWVPDGTSLFWRGVVRNSPTSGFWWNFWTSSPIKVESNQNGNNQSNNNVLHLRATAKLGWMETWDLASVALVSFERQALLPESEQEQIEWDKVQGSIHFVSETNPCTGSLQELLKAGNPDSRENQAARWMLTKVKANHPWAQAQGNLLTWANQHREQIQVGVVQSVDQFSAGGFTYSTQVTGNPPPPRRLIVRYYLPSAPVPPYIDTANCPNDSLNHAWYANRGSPMSVEWRNPTNRNDRRIAYSYSTLDTAWSANIGFEDSPAFVVSRTVRWQVGSAWYTYEVEAQQQNTPTLKFYCAIAARTAFFPYSYVPVIRLKDWQVNFNGSFSGDWYRAENAIREDTSSMTTPETVFGFYNRLLLWSIQPQE